MAMPGCGDAGLWRLQRETLPAATVALDWWHAAMRFAKWVSAQGTA
jgi:hypothetical protein